MAGFYKKMMVSTIEDSISDLCGPYCEPERNQLGFCPTACIPFCYPICNRPFLSAIPPISPIPPVLVTKTTHHQNPVSQTDDSSSSTFLLFFLSLMVIGFSIFLCYALTKFCKSWAESRREAAEERNQNHPDGNFLGQENDEVDNPIWYIRTDGLNSAVINSITVFKFKKDDELIEGTESSGFSVCSVCLSNFQEDETLRLLPKCSHAFHVPCIDAWLKSHKNCPVCRADIVLPPVGLPEQPNYGGDSEFRNQEGAETETNEVELPRGSEYDAMESSRKQY